MRLIVLTVFLAMAAAGSAHAQVGEGPLADPGAAAAPVGKQTHTKPGKTVAAHKAGKPRKAADRSSGAAKKAAEASGSPLPTASSGDEHAVPTSQADRRSAPESGDPVSFGMKWNGNNDTAERTRVQNYNNDAAGTGAEVGLKLHF